MTLAKDGPPKLLRSLIDPALLPPQAGDLKINGLAYAADAVKPGYLFAAWRGLCADGHAHAARAVACGAKVVLAQRPVDVPVPVVVTPDVRAILARAACAFYDNPSASLKMVGITGTNGKTTCCFLLQAMLTAAALPAGRIGTLGAAFGTYKADVGLTTPESVDLVGILAQMRAAGAGAVALEASSQALHQCRLDGVHFDVALFLNLSQDHLDYHGSMEHYWAAKARLAALVKATGKVVLNMDSAAMASLRAEGAVGFSRGTQRCAVMLHKASLAADHTRLVVRTPRGMLTVVSPLCGDFNVENVLASIAAAIALDVPDAAIVRGLAEVAQIPGRLQPIGPGSPQVWVDFAHTPEALRCVLQAVRPLVSGMLWCVFGCGGDRDPHKRAPMGRAVGAAADYAILTADNPRYEAPQAIFDQVAVGLRAAGSCPSDVPCCGGFAIHHDRAQAIGTALRLCGAQDGVVIAGKGHENYQLVQGRALPFDDRCVALAALHKRAQEGA